MSRNEKILTICIPVYNTEKYIKRCLDSVLIKDIINDIEVIVVSDGSKDDSINIARTYLPLYSDGLTIIEKENGGHGSTINAALKVAKGKYFRVLDSDDWFDSEDFIKFVNILKKEDSDLVVTNYSKEHEPDGYSEYLTYDELEDGKQYNFNKFDLKDLKGEYFVMATSTYKTSILRESKLFLLEKTFYVDMIYNIVPITCVNTFSFYNLDIYRYYIGRKEQSVNLNSFVKNHLHHEKVVKYIIEYYTSNMSSWSKNLKSYITLIIKYILYTHYSIYMFYFKPGNEPYEKIIEFDSWLLNKNKELYDIMDDMSDIKMHRKTGFKTLKKSNVLIRKVRTVIKKIRRK